MRSSPGAQPLCGQAGTAQGSTGTCTMATPIAVPRKLSEYTTLQAAFGTHLNAEGHDKHLCDPGQGPNPKTTSNCGRTGSTGARGGQAGQEYGVTADHGAASCYPMRYLSAFPPPSCKDTPGHITAYNTPAHQPGWKGSTIAPPNAIATASTKLGPLPWQVPTYAPPPPPQEALVNSEVSGIAPAGSCSVGPNGLVDSGQVTSAFIPQNPQLPLTCHSNQEAHSAGWGIHGHQQDTAATLKNYHWFSHNAFAPQTYNGPNRQWFFSPCATPVWKTAYCLAPDRLLLGGSTGQIPNELIQGGPATTNAALDALVLAAGGR